MQIRLISVGTRMPEWVRAGFDEYSKRLPREVRLSLIEIAPGRRTKRIPGDRARQEEGERILAAIPPESRVWALDVRGKSWSSEGLSEQLQLWLREGRDVCFMVGGPDGLAEKCLSRADALWSISPLTLPHQLVRVVFAEAIYRAWTILCGHPYHRGG